MLWPSLGGSALCSVWSLPLAHTGTWLPSTRPRSLTQRISVGTPLVATTTGPVKVSLGPVTGSSPTV